MDYWGLVNLLAEFFSFGYNSVYCMELLFQNSQQMLKVNWEVPTVSRPYLIMSHCNFFGLILAFSLSEWMLWTSRRNKGLLIKWDHLSWGFRWTFCTYLTESDKLGRYDCEASVLCPFSGEPIRHLWENISYSICWIIQNEPLLIHSLSAKT